ncbi:anthranilate synthase / indole-3-glycerol phosphate synthase [Coemansia sp. RSA 552]|nr:anthranilate synthase / indole-3-glycerol phosphate synthase [Coemansia sp. RSA 552]
MASPSNTVVKICGVRSVEAAAAAVESGADVIGMIFAPSPRLIGMETAQAIAREIRQDSSDSLVMEALDAGIPRTATASEFFAARGAQLFGGQRRRPLLAGVFQNQPLEHILEVARQVPLDLVQLHGTEDVELAQKIPVPVIKVFHIDDGFSVDGGELFRTFCHSVILLDTKVAAAGQQQGGHGVCFDWTIAGKLAAKGVPFLMAGGLTPANVREAVECGRPWGVDVSSGVETDKVKDPAKIQAFVDGARCGVAFLSSTVESEE